MRVLVACEYSGRVRDAFTALGHDATSCDLLPTESPGRHYVGDVRDLLDGEWDIMIAHPPCTYICKAGVRWLHSDPSRWDDLDEACEFFNDLLDADIKRICVENPVPHRYAIDRLGGRKYSQIVEPWQHGHGETKKTCLWLKGLMPLRPTSVVSGREQRILMMAPSRDRAKARSLTYMGIARAMAEQWGGER